MPFPSPRGLPNPGIESASPALAMVSRPFGLSNLNIFPLLSLQTRFIMISSCRDGVGCTGYQPGPPQGKWPALVPEPLSQLGSKVPGCLKPPPPPQISKAQTQTIHRVTLRDPWSLARPSLPFMVTAWVECGGISPTTHPTLARETQAGQ